MNLPNQQFTISNPITKPTALKDRRGVSIPPNITIKHSNLSHFNTHSTISSTPRLIKTPNFNFSPQTPSCNFFTRNDYPKTPKRNKFSQPALNQDHKHFSQTLTPKQKEIWSQMLSAITEIKQKLNKKNHPVTIGIKRSYEDPEENYYHSNEAEQIQLTSIENSQKESVYSSHCYEALSKVDYDFDKHKKDLNLEDVVPGFEENVSSRFTVYLRNEKTGQLEAPIGQYILTDSSPETPKYYFKPILNRNIMNKDSKWMRLLFQ